MTACPICRKCGAVNSHDPAFPKPLRCYWCKELLATKKRRFRCLECGETKPGPFRTLFDTSDNQVHEVCEECVSLWPEDMISLA